MRAWYICGLVLVMGGCAAERVEIGRLVSRERIVVIESGPEGVVYTVQGKDGRVMARGVTLAELKTREPATGRMMEEGVAWAGE